ncbi:MAG: hypothetical protein IPG45_15090 [Deltaproteobacteria bacterium]|nr:hypothetical protein [Deltaproteobacteria bacterium]
MSARRWALVAGLWFGSGCTELDLSGLSFRCQADEDCTAGVRCVDQVCGGTADAGAMPVEPVRAFALGHLHGCLARGAKLECWGEVQSRTCVSCQQFSPQPRPLPMLTAPGRFWAGGGLVCAEEEQVVRCVSAKDATELTIPWTPRLGLAPLEVAVAGEQVCGLVRPSEIRCDLLSRPANPVLTFTSTQGNFTGLVAGLEHVCGMVRGRAHCAGAPEAYLGLPGLEVVELAAGDQFTCARDPAGQVRCFGRQPATFAADGRYDRLLGRYGFACAHRIGGDWECSGTFIDFAHPSLPVPAPPGALNKDADLQLGGSFVCRLELGVLSCYGTFERGQLGERQPAVFSPELRAQGAERLAAGDHHSCAVFAGGAPRCFGSDAQGQLGGGTSARDWTDFPGLGPVQRWVLGRLETCSLDLQGRLRCLGAGGQIQQEANDLVAAAAGDGVLCGIDRTGAVLCRGEAFGPAFTPVPGLINATQLDLGGKSICVVHDGGRVSCFGFNAGGFIDPNGPQWVSTPTEVPGLSGIVEVAVGLDSACARDAQGQTSCFGWNTTGQLARGNLEARRFEAGPISGPPLVQLSAGIFNYCGLDEGGQVLCWGQAFMGRLGEPLGPDQDTPTLVSLPGAAAQVELGREHGCALLVDGAIHCWGWRWAGGADGRYPIRAEWSEVAR